MRVNEWFHTGPHRDILHPKIREQLRPVWPAAAWRTGVAMARVMAKANSETDDTWTLAPAFGGQTHLSTGDYDLRAVVATPLECQTYIPESAGGSMNILSSTTHAHSTTFPPNAWITEMPVNMFIHNPVQDRVRRAEHVHAQVSVQACWRAGVQVGVVRSL